MASITGVPVEYSGQWTPTKAGDRQAGGVIY